jgi:HEAT repeat protein
MLIAYETFGHLGLFDRTAELIRLASRPRPGRRAGAITKPMTLEMVVQSLKNDRGAKRLRGVLAAKRFVAEHPQLVPLLVRVYLDRNTGHRVAAAAGMVLRAAAGGFEPEAVDELISVIQDRKKCCISDEEKRDDPEERGLRNKHPVRYKALELLRGMSSGQAGVVPAIINVDCSDCMKEECRRSREWIGPGQKQDVATLSSMMFSTRAPVRYDAAICLGYHFESADRVIPLLLDALNDEDSSGMRCVMLASFLRIAGRDQSAAEVVAGALKDANCIVRADAAAMLGDFEVDRATHAAMLVEAMDDFWPPVRRRAAESLGKIALETPKITKRLLAALGDEEFTVRLAAAEALVRLGDRQWIVAAVQFFKTHLADKDQPVRRSAVKAIARIGRDAVGVADMLVRMLAREADWEVANDICIALGSIGQGASKAADTLIEVLENGDRQVTRSAAEALRSIGSAGDGAVAKLIGIMKGSGREISMRVAAAGALLRLAPGGSAVLDDAEEFLRRQVQFRPAMDHWPIELLAYHQPMSPRTVSVLRQFVATYRDKPWASSVVGSDRAVMLAAEGLGRSADPKASGAGTAILVWMMKTGRADFDPAAMEAADAAFWRNDPRIARSMKQANLGRYEYRRGAIEALGRLGPAAARAVDHLQEMTKWKDLRLAPPARAAITRIASKT